MYSKVSVYVLHNFSEMYFIASILFCRTSVISRKCFSRAAFLQVLSGNQLALSPTRYITTKKVTLEKTPFVFCFASVQYCTKEVLSSAFLVEIPSVPKKEPKFF